MIDKVKVAVLDSGIDLEHPAFGGMKISGYQVLETEEQFMLRDGLSDLGDQFGHGTAVSAILMKSQAIELMMFKIYNDTRLTTNVETLVYTLNYIRENLDVDMIHMSLGVREYNQALETVCSSLLAEGKILISAYDNDGAMSFPAAFEGVIGVDTYHECKRTDDFMIVKNSPINVLAKGGNHRLAWVNPPFVINQGSSFSCAYVTKFLAEELAKNKHSMQIEGNKWALKKLEEKAIQTYLNLENSIKYSIVPPFNSKHMAILPWNKEIHSVLNFLDMVQADKVDFHSVGMVMPSARTAQSFSGKHETKIMPYEAIKWDQIDLLVIGHVEEIDLTLRKSTKQELLEKALEHRVDVYTFDTYLYEAFKDKFIEADLQLAIPIKSKKSLVNKLGKLYAIKTPVVGVFGTSNQQGKFTLQLSLRNRFQNLGYRIAQLSTEPTGPLFGMNDCIPFGYASTTEVRDADFVELVNSSLFEMDKQNPDLTIVGCQSGTVPNVYNQIEQLHVSQLQFLLGSNPDIVILCVNLYDDFDYIRRTIGTIENLVETEVVALAISKKTFPKDWELMRGKSVVADDDELMKFKNILEQMFRLKAFIIGEVDEMNALVDVCIESLSQD